MNEYDVIIIGSGPAGYTAAFEAVKKGLKAAIVEKNMNSLGGVCLNEGCIPLKGLLHYSALSDRAAERSVAICRRPEPHRLGQYRSIDVESGTHCAHRALH